ncbi:hypothetical protein HHI36_012116 [Cryptolaemus montrouzieri]|uniref:Variable large protein n=1 Tax=Cryptolaemus montrouzieri TaxID=559131 RepID=A0ABD2NEU9_9CUCU
MMNNRISKIFISILILTICLSYASCDENSSYVSTSMKQLNGTLSNALTFAKGLTTNAVDKTIKAFRSAMNSLMAKKM